MTRMLCAAAALLAPTAALADNDPQQWTTLSATVKLDTHWRVSEELTTRFSNKRQGLYEVESNTLIGYALNDHVTVWAGYTHNPQYFGGDFTVMEHRGRQQVTFDNIAHVLGGSVSLRLRGEERWREGSREPPIACGLTSSSRSLFTRAAGPPWCSATRASSI